MLISKLPAGTDSAILIDRTIVWSISRDHYSGNVITERCEHVGPTRVRLKLRCSTALLGGLPPYSSSRALAPGARRSPSGRALA